MRWFRTFPRWAAALGTALLTLPGPGHAQSIVNTARATWVQGGEARSAVSNTVETPLDRRAAAIDLYHPAFGGAPLAMTPSLCGGAPVPLLPGSATGSTQSYPAATTPSVRVGEILLIRVSAPAANRDPAAPDSLTVTIESALGDKEPLMIFETGADTGIFAGAIRTASVPKVPEPGDCRISTLAGDTIQASLSGTDGTAPLVSTTVAVLPDPFGLVFDSGDGTPVSGARVGIVDAVSGQPAQVFAEDGITPWPAVLISGEPVIDSGGTRTVLAAGEYRFPLMPPGRYRLVVAPPAPYTAPSTAPSEALAGLTRPDGGAFAISEGSYGRPFDLAASDILRIDIPVDRPAMGVTLTKSASRDQAQPGDTVIYVLTVTNPNLGQAQPQALITDTPSPWLRLWPDTLRIDGAPAPQALAVASDGRRFTITPGPIPPGATVRITYAMSVRGDAPPGPAPNRAEARDGAGDPAIAEAVVRVTRDSIASRMTVIGRVALGACRAGGSRPGIPGVRIMLEDGSFAITDSEGRYHFEGVEPGTHVVALAPQTLPPGARAVDCERSSRSAGSALSRFVTGQGGTLAVADFHAEPPPGAVANGPAGEAGRDIAPQVTSPAVESSTPATDRLAAGAETDWLALGDGPAGFLFPAENHNPRIPSIRAVIRHKPGEIVALKVNGQVVDALAMEGTRIAPGGSHAVTIWRGIPLGAKRNVLAATITGANGTPASEHLREVQLVSAPWRAELIPGASRLVADGKTRPIAAVRFTDREGRPVRSGVTGSFTVSEPYESAAMLDQLQLGQLTGAPARLQGAGANWVIEGDDGVAFIELAPTMVSGPLHLGFAFADDTLTRQQQLEGWVVPGDLPFTLVGLAEGTLGTKSVADQMERGGRFDSDLGQNARVAFYAKGRVPGRMLLTLAYDSAKERAGQRLLGAIDPGAYYTIYADGATRRFDAASTEKLYVRLEAGAFYALYGDFVTGFDQTQLARYQRTLTGVKAETRIGPVHALAFAADVAGRFRRDEFQGAGITGPYALGSRALIPNSERVAIEVRDRLRSEIIVSRRELVRFIDYDIDPLAATIRFREPVLSRDFELNPQFIVIDYETAAGEGEAHLNAGLRADVTLGSESAVRIGATAISDRGEGPRTGLAGIDLRARLGDATELRGEIALSRREGADATAWLVEAEHRAAKLDLLAYARQTDRDFGTGQQNGVELGRRKIGVDARYQLNEGASLVARSWHDASLGDGGSRTAVQGDFVHRGLSGDARVGIAYLADRRPDGTRATSTMLDGQATRRLMGDRLELGVGTSIALGSDAAIDLPARHRFRARYAFSDAVRLIGTYEVARGEDIDARTFNLGFELAPWAGARVVSTIGRQDIAEAGARSYAAFGLAQSVTLSPHLTLDATVDGNRELGGANARDLVNPLHPAASGGHLSPDGARFEDFTALTLGIGWRVQNWSATVRGEWRDGEHATRKGLTGGIIRQLGDGVTVGGGASWTRASADGTAATEVVDAALAAAYRPAASEFAALAKLEYRGDRITGAVLGTPGPVGRTALTIAGDARSERLIASLSTSWRPAGDQGGEAVRRSEINLFLGARYNLDRLEAQEIGSTALLGGIDARIGLGERIEVGGSGTLRANLSDGTRAFAIGPQIGLAPAKNTLLTLGYNVKGFRDADFAAARHTETGLYAAVRIKFDSYSLGFLGLGRR